jgi:hypothetical protein
MGAGPSLSHPGAGEQGRLRARQRQHGARGLDVLHLAGGDRDPDGRPSADDLSQIRVGSPRWFPRDAPDHLPRLAMLFCGRCNMDDHVALGIELMIRGLDCKDGEPGC